MADSFTQFSEVIGELTDDEIRWLNEELNPKLDGDEQMDAWRHHRGIGTELWPDFGCHLDEKARTLWLFSDENGSVDGAAALVQRFLAACRPKYVFTLTWAGTCNRLRAGEFGGGAVVVTADRIKWMSTWDWVQKHGERAARRLRA